jgi:hypothetical protein
MISQGMLLVLNDAQDGCDGDFCQWCSEEFQPAMLRVPGVTEAWFYRATKGNPPGPRFLQLYYLSSLSVLDQQEYLRTRGWGESGDAKAMAVFSNTPNLIVGVYEHIFTAPTSPADADLSRVRNLLMVCLDMKIPQLKEEFEDWYRIEHIPALAGSPGVLRGHRYGLISNAKDNQGDPMNYAALYAAECPEAFDNDEWRRRVRTPWTQRLNKYYIGRLRGWYDRIVPFCAMNR